jgi:hypothetical protein
MLGAQTADKGTKNQVFSPHPSSLYTWYRICPRAAGIVVLKSLRGIREAALVGRLLARTDR